VACRLRRLLSVVVAMYASVSSMLAQHFGPGVTVPDAEQETAELEASVKAQGLPPHGHSTKLNKPRTIELTPTRPSFQGLFRTKLGVLRGPPP